MDIGEKIILQCDAEGKPVPDVMWMLPDQGDVMVSVHVKKNFTLCFCCSYEFNLKKHWWNRYSCIFKSI